MNGRHAAPTPDPGHGTDDGSDPGKAPEDHAGFVAVSVRLTGFDEFDLRATGLVRLYHDTTLDQVGRPAVGRFLADLDAAGGDPDRITDETSRDIARAITHLWYLGVWPQLARSTHAALRRERANTAFVVSPEAYTEGLVWRTFHGHPPGAKPPGHGTWAAAPPGAPVRPVARRTEGAA
ncbi:hypothetical protein [Streptomyces griseocarneus]|uniref:hypothetical protein n=1 Tax=Streptomyces griseocarneus TaxID=51201 RepID=UPI00167D04F5|nr:hypothetical protein [Streptomyces griseocarneus]MBZ6474182.1 sorbitol dehydrogenase family protein [Streptomyces griseocarneus]GHG52453.1 hypothetical protein GCM10018779_13740 [Streptomyces griseocarneus]